MRRLALRALAFDGGKPLDPILEVGREHQSSAPALDGAQRARFDRFIKNRFAGARDRARLSDGVGQRSIRFMVDRRQGAGRPDDRARDITGMLRLT